MQDWPIICEHIKHCVKHESRLFDSIDYVTSAANRPLWSFDGNAVRFCHPIAVSVVTAVRCAHGRFQSIHCIHRPFLPSTIHCITCAREPGLLAILPNRWSGTRGTASTSVSSSQFEYLVIRSTAQLIYVCTCCSNNSSATSHCECLCPQCCHS